ncbi:hypothetical protein [Nocardia aurea]|uniref:Cell division protein FtsL n=1 Tax=Nocardia aurea TaxID=2144174 RepID=A0ABV3FMB8_9NOCA
MSIRTRAVPAPGRVARRVQAAERVKSGAAQRAYAKRRTRAEQQSDTPSLPRRRGSVMAARIPFVAAIIAMLGCGLALTLLLTTRAAEDSYQLGDARQLNRTLAEERAALQRDVEAADSAPELAARARELGMIPAKDPARLVIGPDGAVTVIGDPTPAQGAPAPPLNGSTGPAQGERVVPVSTVRQQPAAPQTNAAYGANTPAPTPAPAAPAVGQEPAVVPPGSPVPLAAGHDPSPVVPVPGAPESPQLAEPQRQPDSSPAETPPAEQVPAETSQTEAFPDEPSPDGGAR